MKAWLARLRPTGGHFFRLLSALALALVVWVYVTISQNPEAATTFRNLPLETRGLREGLIMTNDQGIPVSSLENVSLVVQAPQSVRLSVADFSAYVDLSQIQEAGDYQMSVQVEAPASVRTWNVTPEKVTVRLEQRQQALLPIEVQLLGQPGWPYIVGASQVNPAHATVQGPLSRVRLVRRLQARVDLSGRVASFENALISLRALDVAGNEVGGVTISPAQAQVSVPIALQGGHMAVSVVPTTVGQPAPGYYIRLLQVTPNMVTIFSGDPSALVSYLATQPVDISGRSLDMTVTVDLNLPPNVSLINSPSQVTVTVRFGAIVPELQVPLPVRLSGLEETLEATWEPRWVDVRLRGPLEALAGLSLGDLAATVDVGGLGPGEYDLGVTFTAPAQIEVAPVVPITVHVVLVRPTTPVPIPTATPSPSLTPTPSPSLTPTPSPSPTLPPVVSPTPTPTPGTPTPGPSPTPSPMPSPTPAPTP